MTTIHAVPPFPGSSQDLTDRAAAAWDAVEHARTRTLDALSGFDKMAEHTEADFAPIVAAFRELHQRHAEALGRILTDAGRAPDSDGSMMGTVNRVVVATRAMFDDIDHDVLEQIHSGEQHVATAYAKALDTDLPQQVRDRIAQMADELDALLVDTRPVA
jgi:uncharacterized protein (TIGR02284 family)